MSWVEWLKKLLGMTINDEFYDELDLFLKDLILVSPEEYRDQGKEFLDLMEDLCRKLDGKWPVAESRPKLRKLIGTFCSCESGGNGGSGTQELENKRTDSNKLKK